MTFLDAASEKTLRSTVALTAGRGRGKSAALGLAIAGALALGYANIYVTSPSPENLRTLFDFIFKGLDGLGYKEHLDYDMVEVRVSHAEILPFLFISSEDSAPYSYRKTEHKSGLSKGGGASQRLPRPQVL